jgi:anti-sigma-K factor RskA
MNDHQWAEHVPLHALDALDGQELIDFETHLETCAICRADLDEYRAVASSLVRNEAASDETWDRIHTAIRNEAPHPAPQPMTTSNRWGWVAVAASVALVLGGLLGWQLAADGDGGPNSIVVAADQAATDPESIVADFLVDDVAVAQVVLTADGRGYVIPTDELVGLEDDRTYQLWVINNAEDVISAGVLGAQPAPATFTWTGDVSGFALTREVAGGVVSSAGDVVSVITDL